VNHTLFLTILTLLFALSTYAMEHYKPTLSTDDKLWVPLSAEALRIHNSQGADRYKKLATAPKISPEQPSQCSTKHDALLTPLLHDEYRKQSPNTKIAPRPHAKWLSCFSALTNRKRN
jgi:hypothetical protein